MLKTANEPVISTEKPTTLSLSLSDDAPEDAAQPDRMAGTARAAAASARNLFRWVMWVSLFALGIKTT